MTHRGPGAAAGAHENTEEREQLQQAFTIARSLRQNADERATAISSTGAALMAKDLPPLSATRAGYWPG